MKFKVANAQGRPATVRLVKRSGAHVEFSDGVKPQGAVDDATELSFNLAAYIKKMRFVVGSSTTPNIKNPTQYITNGNQFTFDHNAETGDLTLVADLQMATSDPNYDTRQIGIFYCLDAEDGDYVMASLTPNHIVAEVSGTHRTVSKTEIRNSVGVYFNDNKYYIPIYLGTVKNLEAMWTQTNNSIGISTLRTLDDSWLMGDIKLQMNVPIETLAITNVGDLMIDVQTPITYAFTPTDAVIQSVRYESSAPAIASIVPGTNKIVAHQLGKVSIVVTVTDGTGNETSTTKEFNTATTIAPTQLSVRPTATALNFMVTTMDAPARVQVAWGDGELEYRDLSEDTTWNFTKAFDTPPTTNPRIWVLEGDLAELNVENNLDLVGVAAWGDSPIRHPIFGGCANLTTVPATAPLGLKILDRTFAACSSFNAPLNGWDVSGVTLARNTFENCVVFNQPLDNLNFASLENSEMMFKGCTSFNQAIGSWNMSKVISTYSMFEGCISFNHPLANWSLPMLTLGTSMFKGCASFNQPISQFNPIEAVFLDEFLSGCSSFNHPIVWPNTTKVTDLTDFLANATAFNQPLDQLFQGNVTNYTGIFRNCANLNQPFNTWDMSKATKATSMFSGCAKLNQSFAGMDFDNLTQADFMFDGCVELASDFSTFSARSLVIANGMLRNTPKLTGDLRFWCVPNLTSEPDSFATGSGLQREFYPIWGTCMVRDVTLDIAMNGVLKVGATGVASYTADPAIEQTSITWSSSAPTTVSIDHSTGEWVALEAGGATISVLVNGVYTADENIDIEAVMPEITAEMLILSVPPNENASIVSFLGDQPADIFTSQNFNIVRKEGDHSVDIAPSNAPVLIYLKPVEVANPFKMRIAGNINEVVQWSSHAVSETRFEPAASATTIPLTKVPNVAPTGMTSMSFMFKGCNLLNDPNLVDWNVSQVSEFNSTFANCTAFDQPIGNWATLTATSMEGMFSYASAFNQPISNWDVSSVVNMTNMFLGATTFNQPLGDWVVENVTDMTFMFDTVNGVASNYTQDLSTWCVSTIASQPAGWSTAPEARRPAGPHPYWGTCPNRASTLTITAPATMAVGEDVTATYTLNPAFAPGELAWASSDPAIATIDSAGLIHAVAAGTVEITLTINNLFTDIAEVIVQ